jgi:hypothetical protein
MSALRHRLVRLALVTGLSAGVLSTGAQPVVAEEFQPPSPAVDQPLYQPSPNGMTHFTQDRLEKLVAGQSWTWMGTEFEAVRLHGIRDVGVTRDRQANRDYSAPLRGWVVATLHVKVNGRVKAARVECNASYVWQPGGWAWEQVLLYLGNGDSYDFVSGKVR